MVALVPRAGDRDIGQAALLLEAGEAAFVERALRREDAFLPADEEDDREFEALGGVDGHDRDLGLAARRVIVHHQADMLEEGAERLIFLHRAGQFGEVLEAAGGFGAALGLEHGGVAAFVEHQAGELGVGQLVGHRPPAARCRRRSGRATAARLRGQFVAVEHLRGGEEERLAGGAGEAVDALATALSPRPRLGMLTMRSKARSSAGWAMRRR